jgi:hypothetical protein
MSEDLVNQLTLNFLISKNQLHKLNKKIKEDASNLLQEDKKIYGERIKQLFMNLINNNYPDDLLYDVRNSFDLFLNKSIYYFKERDHNELIEKERQDKDEIAEDINFEKEERDIELGNYEENSNQEDEDGDEEDEEDEEEEETKEKETKEKEKEVKKNEIKPPSLIIKEKYTNKTLRSEGVEDIQKLPLNWFDNVRQNYKKNQIIPRRKEINIDNSLEKRKYK